MLHNFIKPVLPLVHDFRHKAGDELKKSKKRIVTGLFSVCVVGSSAVVLANTTDTVPSWMNQANDLVEKKGTKI
jgi:hypothetical protein